MLSNKNKYSSLIKEEAYRLGFDFCGISKADFLEEEAPLLEKWLLQNMHGKMAYMQNHFDKRLDPEYLCQVRKVLYPLYIIIIQTCIKMTKHQR